MKVFFLATAFLAGCASQPASETVTHWARIDGLRKAQNPWIEADFRQAEARCQYEVSLAGDRSPDFIYPSASDAHSGIGADMNVGVANLMRAEVARSGRQNLYNQCMGAHGYYIERVETRQSPYVPQ